MTDSRTLLAALAHPDDEAFAGGSLARYAAEGIHVALVTATRGEAGEISDPTLATPENLAEVRERELRCSCQALGVRELILLGYRDSGMAGTADNANPLAFCNADADEVVGRLVGIIRRLRPQVVLTSDPSGGYGHPDHIAVHRHTVAAFRAAADPARYPETGPAWQPSRLFYPVIPRSFFRELIERLAAMGVDTSQFGPPGEREMGYPDEAVHVTLDVQAYIDAKFASFDCHRTQIGPDSPLRRIPEPLIRSAMSREHFVLGLPESLGPLADLFAGL